MDKDTDGIPESQKELLKQVKVQAEQIKKMHSEMQLMLETCQSIKKEFDAVQQEKVQERMLKLASKAAKKAAKKSIAKAKIKDRLYRNDNEGDSEE